ncbi:MarR family transcriptional regulator [Terriglobus sp. ADX1]|uniref:MarR family transcriptional regulator n=1 Tax=Terriglobus sp. ADX1 TaxID=2794063 RepID=UPI002FE54554
MLAADAAHAADICRSRHRGDANSNAAFEQHSEQFQTSRELVYLKLCRHPLGMTAKELAAHFGVPLHSISGRISELKLAGRVGCTGDRRERSAVVIALNPNKDLLAAVLPRVEMTAEVR